MGPVNLAGPQAHFPVFTGDYARPWAVGAAEATATDCAAMRSPFSGEQNRG